MTDWNVSGTGQARPGVETPSSQGKDVDPSKTPSPVSSGQLGGGNSVGGSAGTGQTSGLNTGFFHDLDAYGTQTLSEMILKISVLSGKLQETRAQRSKNLVNHVKDQLKSNDNLRVKLEQKQDASQHTLHKKKKAGKVLGKILFGLSIALTVMSLGNASPLMALTVGASLLLGGLQQGLAAGGVFAKMADKDPASAKALQGSFMAAQIFLAIASFRLASAGKTIADAASEGGELAAAAADSAADIAKTATAEGEAMLDAISDIATQTGAKMAVAQTGDEQAEIFLEGLDEMLDVVNKFGDEAEEGVSSLSAASDDIVKAQKMEAGIAESEGAIDPEGTNIKMEVDDPDARRIKDLAGRTSKGLTVAKLGTSGVDTANKAEIAKVDQSMTQTKADLKKVAASQTVQKTILDDLEDALKDILEAYSEAMNVPAKVNETLHQTDMKVAGNIGANQASTV